MKFARKRVQSSSLDLLLDAICNAFGGIILLALVVAIQVSLRSREASQQHPSEASGELQSSRLHERLQIDRQQLEQAILIIDNRLKETNDPEVADLHAEISQLKKRMDSTQREHDALTQELAAFQSEKMVVDEQTREMHLRLAESETDLRAMVESLENTIESKVTKLELPRVRSSRKTPIFFAMRYGKLYLALDTISGGEYQPHVTTKHVDDSLLITLRLDGGWSLKNQKDQLDLRSELSRMSPNDYFISVAVWPDSYGDFKKFREQLLEYGYDYHLLPFAENNEMVITSSSKKPLVQ